MSGESLVQRSPADCDVSECDRESSIMRRAWPTRSCYAMEKGQLQLVNLLVIFSLASKSYIVKGFCRFIPVANMFQVIIS